MKLNYRDKVLLTAVIVILVWAVGIMLFIKPAWEDVQTAQTNLESAKVTLSDKEAQVEADKNLKQDIVDAYKNVTQLSNNFYDYQQAQEATQTVDDLLAVDNIENSNMNISSYSTKVLAPYTPYVTIVSTDIDNKVQSYVNAEAPADGTDAAAAEAVSVNETIGCYTISFDYSGSKEDVKNFCEKLKSNDKKTLFVNSIDFRYDEESEDKISGTMSLDLLVLPKLPDPNSTAVASIESEAESETEAAD